MDAKQSSSDGNTGPAKTRQLSSVQANMMPVHIILPYGPCTDLQRGTLRALGSLRMA
jgi:hypothetical protein